MENTAAGAALVAQCVAAGYIGALVHQHWADHRAEIGFTNAFWLTAWTLSFSALFLLNGLLLALGEGLRRTPTCSSARSCSGRPSCSRSPTIRSFTGGRPVRRWIWAVGALLVLRATLWLTTDLLSAHSFAAGGPAVRVAGHRDDGRSRRGGGLVRPQVDDADGAWPGAEHGPDR